ncbi:baseplate hub subunit [Escherichia phage vB_EcoM-E33]|uniref:Baseplate hub subunit n=4 Tax=Dhakavirus TaxID=1914165 RepID=A0A0K1LK04_9CAUD|nr:baseplate wedge subunit [Escherichia phage QL01]YP_009323389.1 baseplate wedge subunit [Escherichia phage WG01]YP_010094230.1 baseplate wedge subunit [Enterobacteria phage vB_EcoM_IME281]YP_010100327.1 baseplate wedge subunit [Escherichia phage AnYang]QHR70616.1 baseplate wedge subunit [Escherichia phage dhaeg]QHR72593.1 baseplate wedge subunit [Escherichia phage dhabil]QLF81426.1 baseplate wedge subunit [Escherichia phage vB_EcoM_FB]QPI13301.1 baseplate hub subunit [Salmonella phage vB_S
MNINKMYSDLDPEMRTSWNRDVAKATGARAVKNSLLGIITTRKGSRPFMPEFGCDISNQLFENITPLITDTIKRNIVSAVRNFEPRISALAVGVTPVYDDNSIIVTVQFSIVDDPDTLEQIRIQLSQSG